MNAPHDRIAFAASDAPRSVDEFESRLRAREARYPIHHPFNQRLNLDFKLDILWALLDAGPRPGLARAGGAMTSGVGVKPPFWLLAELTYRCPLHCVFCSNPCRSPCSWPRRARGLRFAGSSARL